MNTLKLCLKIRMLNRVVLLAALLFALESVHSLGSAFAGFTGTILISGKVGEKFDRETLVVETTGGPVKVPRRLLTRDEDARLAPGMQVSVEAKLPEILKLNGVPVRTLATVDSAGRPCSGSSCGE